MKVWGKRGTHEVWVWVWGKRGTMKCGYGYGVRGVP